MSARGAALDQEALVGGGLPERPRRRRRGGAGPGHGSTPRTQRALLGHDPAVAVDERDLQVAHLLVAAAALDLADGLGDVAHAAGHARLAEAQLAAVGVEREVAVPAQVVLLDERARRHPARRTRPPPA